MNADASARLTHLQATIMTCTRCPRLVAYQQQVSQAKVRRFRHETYGGEASAKFW